MFTEFPTYDKYRTLALKTPNLKGEDVYALQTAINAFAISVVDADGILGPMTDRAIRSAQQKLGLVVDGLAGGMTQKALALALAEPKADAKKVPREALRGQLELESGFRLGIYSERRSDGSYDAGVAQRNTAHTSPPLAFDVPKSIQTLVDNTRKHFDLFAGLDTRRRWALAQGAWNAPAFACYIAREEGAWNVTQGMTLRPSSASRQTFEEYVKRVSQYLTV